MSLTKTKILGLLLIIPFFMILIYFGPITTISQTNNKTLTSANAIITHDPIELLNTTMVQYWVTNGVLVGKGTSTNPYIIANYSFNEGYYGIEIRNINSYILIESNIFQYGYNYAIYIQNSPNIVIKNNTISNAITAGIHVDGSPITIENNKLYHNAEIISISSGNGISGYSLGTGIEISNSNSVSIIQNKFEGNEQYNLNLTSDTNVNITGNDFKTRPKNYSYSIYIEKCTNIFFDSNVVIDTNPSDDIDYINIDASSIWIEGNYFYNSQVSIATSTILNSPIQLSSNIFEQSSVSLYGNGQRIFNNTFIISVLSCNNQLFGNISYNYFTGYDSWLSFTNVNSSIITNNYIENQQVGIDLIDSYFNKISFNYLTNVQIEVFSQVFYNSAINNNTFFGNNFVDKIITIQYYQYNTANVSLNNFWDNGSIGNYWASYTGKDLNKDGIGDSKYNISYLIGIPNLNQFDSYPLMNKSVSLNLSFFNYSLIKMNSLVSSSINQNFIYTTLTTSLTYTNSFPSNYNIPQVSTTDNVLTTINNSVKQTITTAEVNLNFIIFSFLVLSIVAIIRRRN